VGDETQYEISHDVLALVVGQNLTEEMKMREKAGDIYKVYQERKGLFTQDDIDYLRPFQQSLSYPPDLQARIDGSIAAIKQQQEQEQAKTRKRLRTLYSLLGAASIALVVAVILGFIAYRASVATKSALDEMVKAQAEKSKTEFNSLESRANIILSANGCPEAITHIMDSISKKNPDSTNMRLRIKAINDTAQIKGYCK
jgi:hypothetical protein